jgi:hypothetical protein
MASSALDWSPLLSGTSSCGILHHHAGRISTARFLLLFFDAPIVQMGLQ